MTDATLLITGSEGMLARDLAPALRTAGYRVVGGDLPLLDIASPSSVEMLLDATSPAVVINAAAWTDVDRAEADPDGARRANATGPRVLAEICVERGLPLVHFSTDYVFDGQTDHPYREDDPTGPLGVYGHTKLDGERAITDRLPDDHLVIRTAWLYGAHGPCFPRTILNHATSSERLEVVTDQVGCPTWTADLARATAALLQADARGVVNFASADHCSWHELAEVLLELGAQQFPLRARTVKPVTSDAWRRPAQRPAWSVLDTTRYTALTGLTPPHWRDAIERFLARHAHDLLTPYG
jgi:dTDP-4-dehydrorhamnose reductase